MPISLISVQSFKREEFTNILTYTITKGLNLVSSIFCTKSTSPTSYSVSIIIYFYLVIQFSTQAGDNGKRLEDWLEQNPDEAVPVLDEQEAANPPPPPPPRRPRLVAHPPLMLALPLNYSLVDHDDSLANRIISDIAHYLATHYEVDVVEEVNDHYQQGMNQNRSRAVRQYDRREVWEMLLRTLRKHIFD